MESRDLYVQKLKDYFKKREDVVMAFLFGSRAKDHSHTGSDWDIAVYFKPTSGGLEYEEYGRDYPEEDKVSSELADILRSDNIDLVVLNRAPANIADSVLRGIPLSVKNRRLWLEFMLIITGIAADFREFSRDYYDIFMRSASLVSEDADRLRRAIEFVENQMTLYAVFSSMTFVEYENDLINRGAVERWIENLINAFADISKIVLSSSKKPSPYGYADAVRTAALYLKLEEEFWDRFLGWIKLRNILAHEYLDIKWKRIRGFIAESEPYVKNFTGAAKKFLKENRAQ